MAGNNSERAIPRRKAPRSTVVSYLVLLTVAAAVVILWVKIGQSNNTFYIAAGSCATILSLGCVCVWHIRRLRRGYVAHHVSDIETAACVTSEEDSINRKHKLRLFYGEKVDRILTGGPGLDFTTISRVVQQFSYEPGTSFGVDPLRQNEGERDDINEANHQCPICRSKFQAGQRLMRLPCQCCFHRDCLPPHLQQENRCPRCQELAVRLDALLVAMEDSLMNREKSESTDLSGLTETCKRAPCTTRAAASTPDTTNPATWSFWPTPGLQANAWWFSTAIGSPRHLGLTFSAVVPVHVLEHHITVGRGAEGCTARPLGPQRAASASSVTTTGSHPDRDQLLSPV